MNQTYGEICDEIANFFNATPGLQKPNNETWTRHTILELGGDFSGLFIEKWRNAAHVFHILSNGGTLDDIHNYQNEETSQFFDFITEQAKLDEAQENENEEYLREYEYKYKVRLCRFPKETKSCYIGRILHQTNPFVLLSVSGEVLVLEGHHRFNNELPMDRDVFVTLVGYRRNSEWTREKLASITYKEIP